MNAVEATVKNRRIDVPAPDDWPDGTKVVVDVMPALAANCLHDVDFMTEDDQSDDRAAIERWIAELKLTRHHNEAGRRGGNARLEEEGEVIQSGIGSP